jgi:hypothetical protein
LPYREFFARVRDPLQAKQPLKLTSASTIASKDFLTSAGKWLCIDVLPLQLFRAIVLVHVVDAALQQGA